MNKIKKDWYKFDLHHHTFNDKYGGPDRKKELKEDWKEIIDHFYKEKGRLIIITNHDFIDFISVKKYKEYIKKKKYKINVLHGIELGFVHDYKEKDKLCERNVDVTLFFDHEQLEDFKNKNKNIDINEFFFNNEKYYKTRWTDKSFKCKEEKCDSYNDKKSNCNNAKCLNKKYRVGREEITDRERRFFTKKRVDLIKGVHKLFRGLNDHKITFISTIEIISSNTGIKIMSEKEDVYQNPIQYFNLWEYKHKNNIESMKSNIEFLSKQIEKDELQDKNVFFGSDTKNLKRFKETLQKIPFFYADNNFKGLKKIANFSKTRIKRYDDDQKAIVPNYIKSVKIDNDEINLDVGLNIIVGRKGSGKSHLLEKINNFVKNGNSSNNLTYYDNDFPVKPEEIEFLKQNDFLNKVHSQEALSIKNASKYSDELKKSLMKKKKKFMILLKI